MSLAPTFLMFIALAVGVCGMALWKGETPERWTAGLTVVSIALSVILQAFLSVSDYPMLQLVDDGLTALGFLVLTVAYSRLWLGAAMLFQAAQFTLHSYYLVTERANDRFHAIVNNVDFLGIMLALAVGTGIAMWRRRARRTRGASAA